ncbi:hypothetical protein Tco_1293273 [Tanacetum coccineum]
MDGLEATRLIRSFEKNGDWDEATKDEVESYDPSYDQNTDSDATLYSSSSDKTEESTNEIDDANESNMDLSDDNPDGDNDAISSSLDFIQTLLDETPANELTDIMSHPMYNDAQTTSVEMFSDENAHHLSSPSANKMSYLKTNPPPNSLQTKAKKLMQNEKKNIRKINFKKAVAQKFRVYDQKLEALTNFNVFEVFEKAVQAKVLTESKSLYLLIS